MSGPDDRPLRAADEGTAAPPLTPEQEAAVRRVGGTTLVAAAAGSGKTRVLTERVVRAVTEPVVEGPDGTSVPRAVLGAVLAITFTDKAAGELRERIRRGLERSSRPELARDVEQASIGTIHAFCARLLRGHALAAGLDPRFAVLDDRQARVLRAEAWSAALEGFLAAHGDPALDLLAAHGADPVHAAITHVHDDLRSQIGEPRLPPLQPADPGPAVAALGHAAQAALADLRDEQGGNGTMQRALEGLRDCAEAVDALAPGARPAVGDLQGLAVKAGNVKRLKDPAYQAFLDAHLACLQALTDADAVADYHLLDELLHGYARRYAAAKARTGGLDFDDLELRARDLLREHPVVAERIRGRYACILVDEFQDTNPVQLELVQRLGGEDVFLVGDAFQSIYAFRHADVRVFRAVQEEVRQTGGALDLAGNFRSDPRIVEAVNAAFSRLFDRTFVPMVGRAPLTPPAPPAPVLELLVTDGPAWTDASKAPQPPDLGTTLRPEPLWRQAEARLLAQRLHDLLEEDPGLRPGHIAVLVRARKSMEVMQRALADVGLDTLISGSRGYWAHPQVLDLVGWLRLLANPRDERTLWHVLGSPLVGVSTDAMALLAMAARQDEVRPWDVLHARLGGAGGAPVRLDDPLQHLDPGDRERLAALALRLAQEREVLGRCSLEALIARVVGATAYDAYVLSLPDGERRLAAVRKLRRLAGTHESEHGRDLRGFLDVIAEEQEAGDREPEAPVALTDDDAVQLMTIHAAKGLEFDVVAVFDVGRQENRDDLLLTVEGARAGIRLRRLGEPGSRPALAYAQLRQEALEAARQEDRRLIYVALTRARRRLLVSGTLRSKKGTSESDALTWLGPALDPGLLDARGDPDAPVHREVAAGERPGGAPIAVVLSRPPAPARPGGAIRPEMLAPALARAQAQGEPAPPPAPIAPAAPAGGIPVHVDAVSFSSLSAYLDCGRCYHLERVLGLEPDLPAPGAGPPEGDAAAAELDALVRGRVVHALLEEIDFGAPQAPRPERVAELLAAEGAPARDRDIAALTALVGAFTGAPVRARLAGAADVRREQSFAFTVGEDLPVLHGILDVIAREEGGGAVVVDYKTNRVEGLDLAVVVRDGYALQRDIYALAALRAGAPAVDVVYVFLERPGEPVASRFTAADAPALEATIRAALAPLAAGAFPVGPGVHGHRFSWCPGAP